MIIRKYLLLILLTGLLTAFHSQAARTVSPPEIPGSTKVNAEGVIRLVESKPELVIIDSRIRHDRLQGYIEGSVSLPDEETSCATLKKVIKTKTTPTLYYCNGPKCGRSANAVKIALKCGYRNIFWFRGGFEEWKKKHYPILKQ